MPIKRAFFQTSPIFYMECCQKAIYFGNIGLNNQLFTNQFIEGESRESI